MITVVDSVNNCGRGNGEEGDGPLRGWVAELDMCTVAVLPRCCVLPPGCALLPRAAHQPWASASVVGSLFPPGLERRMT